MTALQVLVALLAIIIYLVYILSTKKFDYWKNKNVPFVKPLPIVGNYGKYILLREYSGHVVQKLCQKFPKLPYFGVFYGTEPVLIVQCPELLRHVLTKDFYYFNGREVSEHGHKECVTKNIFFASNDNWKIVRQNMSPLFSSLKMKNMFHLIQKCNYVLEDTLDREVNMSNVIDARDICSRFSMDSICSCVFGVNANTLSNPVNNPFKLMADAIFSTTNYRGFKLIFRSIWPGIFYGIGLQCFPSIIDTFFSQLLKNIFESRNYTPSSRNDFVDLLLNVKKQDVIIGDSIKNVKTGLDEKVHLKVDDSELASQSIALFGAGFDTTSTTFSFTLYELAKNPEVQKRAVQEVDDYLFRHNNTLEYECIKEMPYLEACIYETLRRYPVLGNLTREVMDDVTLPDGLHLDKGIRVHIPVYTLHHNPEYFPEPEAYKPERFLPENKINVRPYTFMPYGEGPRVCIGKRFSKMELVAGLVCFFKKYEVKLADGMSTTVKLECRTIPIQPAEGLMLKITTRQGWEQRKFVRS